MINDDGQRSSWYCLGLMGLNKFTISNNFLCQFLQCAISGVVGIGRTVSYNN
jgi:hypothetical protein